MSTAAVRRKDDGKWGRTYETPAGTFPSVTSILEVIGKPALMHWAAKEERIMCIRVAGELYQTLPATAPKLDNASFVMALEQRLGETKAHAKLSAKAKDIGSGVHSYIEYKIRKHLGQVGLEEPALPDGGLHAYKAFQDWARSVTFKPRLIEQVVWSQVHQYAGTMDILAQLEIPPLLYLPSAEAPRDPSHKAVRTGLPGGGQIMAIIDWKTSKAIYWEAYLQVAAYIHALIEMGHAERPLHAMIVRLPKLATDPGFETRFIHDEDVVRLMDTFIATKKVWYGRSEWSE